jgi:DNA-binding IclR family transcriptional regulator
VDDVGETFNLVVHDQCFGTYFDRIEANWPLKVRFNVGSTVPLHCTAGGKLYLSLLPEIERRLVLESLPLSPFTNRTFTDRWIFEKHLAEIAARDYSTNQEEFFPRLIAVGVPVRDAGKRLLATLVMPASMSRMSLVEAETYVPRMRQAAARLGSVLEMDEASFDRAAAF